MSEVGKPSGLVRRQDSASWQLRQRWPKHLRQSGDPAEVWVSLETTSYREALEKLPEARDELQRRFNHIAKANPPSPIRSRSIARAGWPTDETFPWLSSDQAASLAQSYFWEVVQGLDAEAPAHWSRGEADCQSWQIELEDMLGRFTGPADPQGDELVVGVTIRVLRQNRLRALPGEEACNLLRNYLRRALAQCYRIMIARLDGDYSHQITDSLFSGTLHKRRDAVPPVVDAQLSRQGTTSLDPDVVNDWSAERGVSQKGVDKHRAVARWFHEYAGVIPVEAITKHDVLTFKRKMLAAGVSAANVNTKLSCLRTLLGYAVDSDLLKANPATGVYVHDKDRDRRTRKEFDLPSLRALFASPVYWTDHRPTQGRGEAAYWLPLIALYTGARLEEIAQLRVIDVREEPYMDGDDREQTAWFICVVQEEGLSTKNANSERRIPVHPDLVRLGLIKHVDHALAAGDERLFPALTPNKYGRLGAKWGEWWSVYRREVCGITDRRMVFHSFRHTFKYHARHVGMIEGVQRQIMGHSPGDTADEYGPSGYSLHQLVEGMKLYRIPGLTLPKPPPHCR